MTDIKSILSVIPTALGFIAMFFPAIKPFIPVIEAAIAAVETVMNSTAGIDLAAAIKSVESHLTPGMQNADALGPNSVAVAHQAAQGN